jgi:hypothetical protein
MVEAVSGEGRMGRVGLVSMLKDRIKDKESGIGAPFPRKGELPPPPPLPRRIVCVMYVSQPLGPLSTHKYIPRPIGRRAGRRARCKARSAN